MEIIFHSHHAAISPRLQQRAELDFFREIGRRHHDNRKHDGSLGITLGKCRQPLGPAHDCVPISDDMAEALQKAAPAYAKEVWLDCDHFFNGVDRVAEANLVIDYVMEKLPKEK